MVAERNLDLLEWFEDDERQLCSECGKQAVVGAEGAPEFRVCLGCAAVWIAEERVDNLRLLTEWPPGKLSP